MVARRLRKEGVAARGFSLTWRYPDFTTYTKRVYTGQQNDIPGHWKIDGLYKIEGQAEASWCHSLQHSKINGDFFFDREE
jgi:hypothetical protein